MPEGLSWSWELDMDELLAALGIPADAGMSADPEDQQAVLDAAAASRALPPGELAGLIAEHLPVGPGLAGWLASAPATELQDRALPGVAASWRRLASWAQAGELAAIAQIASRAASHDDKIAVAANGRPAQTPADAASEVALALAMSQYGASWWTDLGVSLAWRLAATGAALSAGEIDLSRARLIVEATGLLDDDAARAVEAQILPNAGFQTTGQLRAVLRRAVIAADPEGAERRREEAERRAKVSLYPDEEGTATLAGQSLPGTRAAAAMARINALARAMKASGACGGIDLLRAQAFVGLLLGTLPFIPPAADGPPDEPPGDSGRDDSGLDGSGRPGAGRGGRRPGDSAPDGPGRCRRTTDTPDNPDTLDNSDTPDNTDIPGNSHTSGDSSTCRADECDPADPVAGGHRPAAQDVDDDDPADRDADIYDPADRGADTCESGDPGCNDHGPGAGARNTSAWADDDDDDWTGRFPGSEWPDLAAFVRPAPAALGSMGLAAGAMLDLTLPWTTLAGISFEPGFVGRLGPVTSTQARHLANLASADPSVEWRVILTSPQGEALAVTRIPRRRAGPTGHDGQVPPHDGQVPPRDSRAQPRGRPDWPRGRPDRPHHGSARRLDEPVGDIGLVSRVTLIVPTDLLDKSSARVDECPDGDWPYGDQTCGPILAAAMRAAGRAAARAAAAATADAAAGGCAHTAASAAYKPPPRLRELIAARDQTCRFPTCRQPVWRCDLDHTIPHDDGGPTCSCNLGGLCRTHHRLKQHPRWQLAQIAPGTFTWTTAAGRAYTTCPDIHPT